MRVSPSRMPFEGGSARASGRPPGAPGAVTRMSDRARPCGQTLEHRAVAPLPHGPHPAHARPRCGPRNLPGARWIIDRAVLGQTGAPPVAPPSRVGSPAAPCGEVVTAILRVPGHDGSLSQARP